jgi:hypothetical protein
MAPPLTWRGREVDPVARGAASSKVAATKEAWMRFAAAVAMVLALSAQAIAEDAPNPPAKPVETPAATEAVLAFGVSHPDCQEWSDGCVICKRGADVVACSTPGIACLPTEPVCKAPPPK